MKIRRIDKNFSEKENPVTAPVAPPADLTDAELAALADLEPAAAPAPWVVADANDGDHPLPFWVVGPAAEDGDWDLEVHVGTKADADFIAALRNAWPRLVASLRSAREELEAARVVTTLYAWTGGSQETERELALFQAWHEYVTTYGTPNPSDEWDQRIADLAARRRARQAEVRAGLAKIVTTEEGADRGSV